jgi:hypothetical protein
MAKKLTPTKLKRTKHFNGLFRNICEIAACRRPTAFAKILQNLKSRQLPGTPLGWPRFYSDKRSMAVALKDTADISLQRGRKFSEDFEQFDTIWPRGCVKLQHD